MRILQPALMLLTVILLASCMGGRKGDKFSFDNKYGDYKVGNPYQVSGKWYYPKVQSDYDKKGIASWYGSEFHGKKTANGDVFDKHALTAAHNTLPLPSMIRVTNLENNKSAILMVNDRGPFSKDRILDVSERAAQILGFANKGTAKVRVQFLPEETSKLLAIVEESKKGKKRFPFLGKFNSSKLNEYQSTHESSFEKNEAGNANKKLVTKDNKSIQDLANDEMLEVSLLSESSSKFYGLAVADGIEAETGKVKNDLSWIDK